MSNSDFKPKLGKPKSDRDNTSTRVTRLVVKAAKRQRTANSPWANALTKRPVAELGRGKGAVYGLSPPQPGWRRVIVKARIARHGTSDLGAARAHQHYIMRDGVTRTGGPGQLYDREHDIADGGTFLDNQKGDTYQFRLIVAPEDAARMASLKPFIRDLMIDMEEDLRTKLDWVAVDHYNTGHPHTHIVIAGHDDCGQDLVMARHYISHGIRTRARDLVTLELGPGTGVRARDQARQRDEGRAVYVAGLRNPERRPRECAGRLSHGRWHPRPSGVAGRPIAASAADGTGRGKEDRRLAH